MYSGLCDLHFSARPYSISGNVHALTHLTFLTTAASVHAVEDARVLPVSKLWRLVRGRKVCLL
jgi:hypothetical protein